MFKKLLVAFDGSDESRRALRVGVDMARCGSIELHSISVEEELPKYAATLAEQDEFKKESDRFFAALNQEAEAIANKAGVKLHSHTVVGREIDAIVKFVFENGFDLLITGFHGHSAIHERIYGSIDSGLMLYCPCSLLMVK
jgi:nucleotide-binding universal stress UspA family protein